MSKVATALVVVALAAVVYAGVDVDVNTLPDQETYVRNSLRRSNSFGDDDCSNFNGQDACQNDNIDEPEERENRRWQTPPRGHALWHKDFQDMSNLQGYAETVYESSMAKATVTVHAFVKGSNGDTLYQFNGEAKTSDNTYLVDSSFTKPLSIAVFSGKYELKLEDVDFVWSAPEVKQSSEYESGQKGAIVELFGWPYADIEKECEALGKMGYMGVKVFPPQEAVTSFTQLQNNELNPWYFLYQPVSYRLDSRMGTRDDLRSMIYTCRAANVRVYADFVGNHMSGNGNDAAPDHRNGQGGSCAHWGPKNGTASSPFYTQGFQFSNSEFTGHHPGQEYPSVPYGPTDFHCERVLSDWSSPLELNAGWLSGLCDLNTEKKYVRQRLVAYIVDLLGLGVSGIRIDAAKHMGPENLAAIFAMLKTNMGGKLPVDFIAYLEVIIGGEKDLLMCDDDSKYQFGKKFTHQLSDAGLTDDEVNMIKIWDSTYPKEFPICGDWVVPAERLAIENDCHDDQNPGSSSRDMGDKGSVLIKEKDIDKHRGFEVELFTRTDGNWKIKLVLSSYTFMNNGAAGFPDGLSDCKRCVGECDNCIGVPFAAAHDPNVCGYTVNGKDSGSWGEGQYTRVHRDKQIIMAMRKWMGLSTNVSNKDIGLPDSCQ